MASPHVAGVVALYLETHAAATPAQVAQAILAAAIPGKLTSIGADSPNLLLSALVPGNELPNPGSTPTPAPSPSPAPTPSPSPTPSPTPSPIPPPDAPCEDCTLYQGTLSGAGSKQYQPNGKYYYSPSAKTQRAALAGPEDADFDLYLLKWSGRSWTAVTKSDSPSFKEAISYSGTGGYYIWVVRSYRGSGNYQLSISPPLGSGHQEPVPGPRFRFLAPGSWNLFQSSY
jgi:hypothetical protein